MMVKKTLMFALVCLSLNNSLLGVQNQEKPLTLGQKVFATGCFIAIVCGVVADYQQRHAEWDQVDQFAQGVPTRYQRCAKKCDGTGNDFCYKDCFRQVMQGTENQASAMYAEMMQRTVDNCVQQGLASKHCELSNKVQKGQKGCAQVCAESSIQYSEQQRNNIHESGMRLGQTYFGGDCGSFCKFRGSRVGTVMKQANSGR